LFQQADAFPQCRPAHAELLGHGELVDLAAGLDVAVHDEAADHGNQAANQRVGEFAGKRLQFGH
jgi:hypothetical protein